MTAIFEAHNRGCGGCHRINHLRVNEIIGTQEGVAVSEPLENSGIVKVSERSAHRPIPCHVKQNASWTDRTSGRNIVYEKPLNLTFCQTTDVVAQNLRQKIIWQSGKQRPSHGFKSGSGRWKRIDEKSINLEIPICVEAGKGDKSAPRMGNDCYSTVDGEASHDRETMVSDSIKRHIFETQNHVTCTELVKIVQLPSATQKIEVRSKIGMGETRTSMQHYNRLPLPNLMDRSHPESSIYTDNLVGHFMRISSHQESSIRIRRCQTHLFSASGVCAISLETT